MDRLKNPKNQLKDWVLLGISILLFVVFIWLFSIPKIFIQETGSIEWYLPLMLTIITGLVFCAVLYFAASIYTPIKAASDARKKANELSERREKAEKTTNALLLHLRKIGLDVTIESKEPKQLCDQYFILSSIRVENKNIDLIKLEWQRVEWQAEHGVGGYDDYYQCTYMIQIKMKSLLMQQFLLTRSKPIYKHFFSRQIINLIWEGKDLAQTLNNDVHLTTYLISQPHIAKVQIIPHNQFIEIRQDHHNSSPNLAFPTFETFEAYNKIAQHIRSVANKL